MNWLTITFIAYFLLSLEIVLDKFLLSSKRVSHPVLYAFYSAATGLFSLIFIPFGSHALDYAKILYYLIGGIVFIYGMLSLFFALNKGEASRVMPVVGAVVPIVTFFLSIIYLGESLFLNEVSGIIFLIIGGLLISLDYSPKSKAKFFSGFKMAVLSGFLLAIAATMFKKCYAQDNFINVYVWTRIGAFLGILSFFLTPEWRVIILKSLSKFKKPEKENKKSGALYIISRSMGGAGSILKEKATSFAAASVTVVNALVSVEYVFVFILSIGFSLWFPSFFEERKDLKTIIQKIAAILIITAGIYLIFKQ